MGFSLLVVERGMEGFERGRKLDKIGLDAQDTAELSFTDVQVPAENLLGEEGQGFIYLMQNLPQERIGIAVMAAAAMEAVLEQTLQYTKERKAFGRPIGSQQNSRFLLAELATEATVVRMMVDEFIKLHLEEKLTAEQAAMAKWYSTEKQVYLIDRCLQLHGGYGYMREYPVARALSRRTRADDLRRHDRDHEGDHRPQPGRLTPRPDDAASVFAASAVVCTAHCRPGIFSPTSVMVLGN